MPWRRPERPAARRMTAIESRQSIWMRSLACSARSDRLAADLRAKLGFRGSTTAGDPAADQRSGSAQPRSSGTQCAADISASLPRTRILGSMKACRAASFGGCTERPHCEHGPSNRAAAHPSWQPRQSPGLCVYNMTILLNKNREDRRRRTDRAFQQRRLEVRTWREAGICRTVEAARSIGVVRLAGWEKVTGKGTNDVDRTASFHAV